MARRVGLTVAAVAVLALAYVAFALGGLAPWPRSLSSIAGAGAPHGGYALVSGYYITVPFVSNGNGMPPYAFSDMPNLARGESVRVAPALGELRAYRVIAVIDTATGDGSEWNPYVIHTVGSVTVVVVAALAGGLMLLALLFWLAGYVLMVSAPRTARSEARRAAS